MTLPDFLIIGAMKCGTSTLAAQLGAQEGLFMTTPKEPNYFSDDAVFAKGPDWYAALFSEAPAGALRGEASTHYTKRPDLDQTLTRMLEAFSTPPRLIYVIRNPLERAVSHYIHEWSEARLSNDADAAFAQDQSLVNYGRYAYQIRPYIEAFGSEAVLMTSLEAIKHAPQDTLTAIGAHLGRPGLRWKTDLEAQNVSAQRVRPLPLHGLLVENPVARALRRTLVPKALRNRVKAARSMADRPTIPETVQARLIETFCADRLELAELFPNHPALDACYPFARP